MNGKQAKRLRRAARGRGEPVTTYKETKYPRIIGFHKDEDGNDDKKKPIVIHKVTKYIDHTCLRRVYHMMRRSFLKMNHIQRNQLMDMVGQSRAAKARQARVRPYLADAEIPADA